MNAESKEEDFIRLENELETKFIETVKIANELGAKINATNVINYIHHYGAVGGANRLIKIGKDKLHSGILKLWKINRLDISFENIILQDRFKILFDKEILEKAKERLNEFNTK